MFHAADEFPPAQRAADEFASCQALLIVATRTAPCLGDYRALSNRTWFLRSPNLVMIFSLNDEM
jgi:hypothetical protein